MRVSANVIPQAAEKLRSQTAIVNILQVLTQSLDNIWFGAIGKLALKLIEREVDDIVVVDFLDREVIR